MEWSLISHDPVDWVALGFVTTSFVLLHMLELRLPRGDVLRIDALAVVSSVILGNPFIASMSMLFAVAVSVYVSWQTGIPRKWDVALEDGARRAILVGICTGVALSVGESQALPPGYAQALPALLGGFLYMVFDITLYAIGRALGERLHLVTGIVQTARVLGFIYVGQVCLGGAVVLVYPELGLWGVLPLSLLGLILTNSFELYLRVRRAYQDMIKMLAGVAELAWPRMQGHAQGVAEIAVQVGRRRGLNGHWLEVLNYAALLHDVGLMEAYPEDALSAEEVPTHAEVGAQIAANVPFLRDVSGIIRNHHGSDRQPRGHVGARGAETLLCARIVKVVSLWDLSTRFASGGERFSPTDIGVARGWGEEDMRLAVDVERVLARSAAHKGM
ncbi:MAG: HD-GYP domain-containing protein [Coriobacteriia bacterium]